jgi:alcohol dehydrogenase
MVMDGFTFGRCPRVLFGSGTFQDLGIIAGSFGRKALLITGASSLQSSGRLAALLQDLESRSVSCWHVAVRGEPSPEFVDTAVGEHGALGIESVMAVGGGSAIDAGKAISAMLPLGAPVADYLEGMGNGAHTGKSFLSSRCLPPRERGARLPATPCSAAPAQGASRDPYVTRASTPMSR